ncbi:SKP1-like protein 21 isoform X2 [Iris pallida]|uniref:SKP1-like protein 21 isoform X2 n=1 Tax=Iris pallida TaxID=29817 RepID=A0AAX6H7X0_IRIPA|nr:SKP1-like protein 21 isoform X2 [Iris pallida]
MSESEMAIIKPEAMKSYIWIQCADGSIQQVEEEIAMFCPMIRHEILQKGKGSSKNYAISLPEPIYPAILSLILDYCRFHQTPGRSNKERKSFNEKFVKTDADQLCELASAAHSLQLKPLIDLTCRALARMMEGKSPEEIRETFHIEDDLTEEEKLEPMENATCDPRIRLINRLNAKKRKELQERQRIKDAEVEEERVDERSVDELLSFINGNGDSKGNKAAKQKKKNRRRKNQLKNPCTNEEKTLKMEVVSPTLCHDASGKFASSESRTEVRHGNAEDEFQSKFEFDDADNDDELDPAMKEEIDREVEDFARRLNCGWAERMQEILCSGGQERRLLPNLTNGNFSLRKYTGVDRR